MRYTNQSISIDGTPVKQVNKTQARELYDAGKTIYMHPSNMVLNGPWGGTCPIAKVDDDGDPHAFDSRVNSMEWYMEPSLGRYTNFFVKIESEIDQALRKAHNNIKSKSRVGEYEELLSLLEKEIYKLEKK